MSIAPKRSIGPTRLPGAAVVAFVLFCLLPPALSPSGVVAAEPGVRARASALVSRLGHQEFAMRERAAAELIALELDAAAALKNGTQSRDREIRLRSTKLLGWISQIDLERRFERFKNDPDTEQDYGLPGWDAFREVVGDSPESRAVFVSMHEEESQLLGQVGGNQKRLVDALADRCDQLRGQTIFGRVQVRLGTTATLLFVATRDGVEVSPLVQAVVFMACGGSSFGAAVESGPSREVLATLAERWIDRQPPQATTNALDLGLSLGLKGCLPRAREVFQSPVASLSDRIFACLCLCSFGDESDFARLETYLDDVNICVRGAVNGEIVVTEMRDIALACLVRLAKQEPREFGFDRLELERRMVFNLASLGFRDEQSRVRAIEAWREFRRSTAKPEAP